MSIDDIITKDNIEKYIEMLAKEYKKISKNKYLANIILVYAPHFFNNAP